MQLDGGLETHEGHLDRVEHLRHHHGGVADDKDGDDDDSDAGERVSHVAERGLGSAGRFFVEKEVHRVLLVGPAECRDYFNVEEDEEDDGDDVTD